MIFTEIAIDYIVAKIYVFLAALFSGDYTFIVLGDDEVPLAGPGSAKVSIWWFAALVFIVCIASAYVIKKKKMIERIKELEEETGVEHTDYPSTLKELYAEIESLENEKVSKINLDS